MQQPAAGAKWRGAGISENVGSISEFYCCGWPCVAWPLHSRFGRPFGLSPRRCYPPQPARCHPLLQRHGRRGRATAPRSGSEFMLHQFRSPFLLKLTRVVLAGRTAGSQQGRRVYWVQSPPPALEMKTPDEFPHLKKKNQNFTEKKSYNVSNTTSLKKKEIF